MFGPALSATGGIAAVVNNWIDAGLTDLIKLRYLSTLDCNGPGNYFSKLRSGIRSYIKYLTTKSDDYNLIHIHLSSQMSFYRKLVVFLIGIIISSNYVLRIFVRSLFQ